MNRNPTQVFPETYDVPDAVRLRHQLLLGAAYRRRGGQRSRRFAFGGVGVAAAAAAAVVVTTLNAGTPSAWAATPTVQPSTALPALGATCAERIQNAHFPIKFGASRPVLAEKRGSTTAVVLSATGKTGVCFNGPDNDFSGFYNNDPHPVGAATVFGLVGAAGGGGRAARVLLGTASANVTSVTVTGVGSKPIQASLSSGYFLAWWPGDLASGPGQLVVTTASGTTSMPLSQLNDELPSPAPSPTATR